jgi:hypothetical protein
MRLPQRLRRRARMNPLLAMSLHQMQRMPTKLPRRLQ